MNTITNSTNFLKESFDDFFEGALCGYIIASPKGIIEKVNGKVGEWTGYTVDELNGKRISDLLSIGGKIYYETHLSPLLRMQGYFDEVVLELANSSGQKFRVMVNAIERRDDEGKPLFARFTILKASDRLLYEQNLRQAKALAEDELEKQTAVVAIREQLIAVLGHDLRNPLAAISMAVELLEMSQPTDDNIEIVATLKRSSLRMKELVNNIMDFARTRLGDGILLTRENVTLTPVLQQVVDELQLSNNCREIVTSFHINEPVNCDPHRLGQLLSNLLANALTHGAINSPVYVSAKYSNQVLELSVTNNGDPIPPEIQVNIFSPFTRELNSPSQQGLGLGLYISKEIAQAHKGILTCTSTAEETIFTFTMPA